MINKNKLKIILVFAPTGKIGNYNTPAGLLYIATVLKRSGNEVKFVDCSVEHSYNEILDNEIKDADILGVYAMSHQIRYLLPMLKRLKRTNKKIKIIWGGPHATLFHEQTAKSPFADIVVRGEGEETIMEIIKGYESGNLNLRKVKGITFEENDKIVVTENRDFIDMNWLPFIDWSFVKPNVMENIRRGIIRVQASRGCPYNCAFCINVVSGNRKKRYRNPKKVIDEIEHLYEKYGIKRVGFRDEIFMIDRNQVKEIAQGLIDKNIKITWLANIRATQLRESFIDDNYLKLLVDSGCDKLSCGGESGSKRVLNLLNKGITPDDIIHFVKRVTKFNIIPVVSFMTGIPTETEEEQMETLKLIRELLRINPKTFINGPANYRPYPGGDLYDMCVRKYNVKTPNSLEEWANSDVLGGKRTPWIKKTYLNEYLWTSVMLATFKSETVWKNIFNNPIRGLGILLLSRISKLRLKFLFYKFPFEFVMLHLYHKFVLGKPPVFS
jgi:radical SAM superfamily enzyme YgiQ (UPF0313 family)